MALFKKKSKAIIPEPPKMQPYPEAEQLEDSIMAAPVGGEGGILPELPEMPESFGEESSEETTEEVEEAVEEPEEAEELEEKPKFKSKLIQELRGKPSLPTREKPAARELKIKRSNEPKALFIKIDKFKEILASIDMIEKRINEIEDVISKLKEIKSREDVLMNNWQQEIESLKSKIEMIQKNLSEKVE